MLKINFVGLIILIIIGYLCIHSLVDRICRCIERTTAFKYGNQSNKNIEIKRVEELQESEQ